MFAHSGAWCSFEGEKTSVGCWQCCCCGVLSQLFSITLLQATLFWQLRQDTKGGESGEMKRQRQNHHDYRWCNSTSSLTLLCLGDCWMQIEPAVRKLRFQLWLSLKLAFPLASHFPPLGLIFFHLKMVSRRLLEGNLVELSDLHPDRMLGSPGEFKSYGCPDPTCRDSDVNGLLQGGDCPYVSRVHSGLTATMNLKSPWSSYTTWFFINYLRKWCFSFEGIKILCE